MSTNPRAVSGPVDESGQLADCSVQDDRPKAGQLSPQRFDKEMPRYAPNTSPTRTFGPTPFSATTTPKTNYEPLQAADDLTVAMRGLAVAQDDFPRQRERLQAPSVPEPSPRAQGQSPYSATFLQPEFNNSPYYPPPMAGTGFRDYQYGYEPYQVASDLGVFSPLLPSPSLSVFPPSYTAVADMARPGMYFDYSGARSPASPYMYAGPQPMMFPMPMSPMTPMMPSPLTSQPATLSEKKRELSVRVLSTRSPFC